ncbi:MAG TPA: transglycosylase SLT domain-containing protein [Candidatus Avibacteroides excrementipullorum]|nr:transglycosylase SLT domain-containing protein [Candidatus Avibacteroides excrementipullorum]
MKKILFFMGIILAGIPALAQNETTGKYEEVVIPQALEQPIDSLLDEWKVKHYVLASDSDCMKGSNPYFPDSVYIDRLVKMPTVMEMAYNEVVRKYIDTYVEGKMREKVSYMLGAANFYIPIFEEALEAYGLPLELKYLPIIESALNPSAVSRAGAAGLWQFMTSTAKIYGLTVNSLVDERRDPIKSTWAAARYLKDLYDIYKDWNLVIAAYNCGPGNVNKAIKRTEGKADYWEIYYNLPKETRGYVPAFIAANYVMTYYCDHNICPMQTDLSMTTDTIHVNKQLHFKQIAEVCDIPMDEIRDLNPQYRRDIIPGNSQECILRLPNEHLHTLISNMDSVYNHKKNQLFTHRATVNLKETTSAKQASAVVYHKIRSGDTLSTIARRYGTTVSRIKKLNGLKNNNIRAGKTIRVK